ncbi:MAG TPA: response regulator [Thermoanaerobaculia bacterium]|jgi:DNA-binding response OmpR family regulator
MVQPSCPVLVVHEDDTFRKSLIAALDQQNFTVTFTPDGDGAVDLLRRRKFRVVLVGVNLAEERGTRTLEFLRNEREGLGSAVLILGDPDPRIRSHAPWADETMLKPVDAAYVARRARAYCD